MSTRKRPLRLVASASMWRMLTNQARQAQVFIKWRPTPDRPPPCDRRAFGSTWCFPCFPFTTGRRKRRKKCPSNTKNSAIFASSSLVPPLSQQLLTFCGGSTVQCQLFTAGSCAADELVQMPFETIKALLNLFTHFFFFALPLSFVLLYNHRTFVQKKLELYATLQNISNVCVHYVQNIQSVM